MWGRRLSTQGITIRPPLNDLGVAETWQVFKTCQVWSST
jgi:hypothetical protein